MVWRFGSSTVVRVRSRRTWRVPIVARDHVGLEYEDMPYHEARYREHQSRAFVEGV